MKKDRPRENDEQSDILLSDGMAKMIIKYQIQN